MCAGVGAVLWRAMSDASAYPATIAARLSIRAEQAAATIGLLAWLQRRLGDPLWPRPPLFQRLETAAPAILGVHAATSRIPDGASLTVDANTGCVHLTSTERGADR